MLRTRYVLAVLVALVCTVAAYGTIFGTVRGVVHDPQGRPVVGAEVTISATGSAWTQSMKSRANGQFAFSDVSVGDYVITVSQQGFGTVRETITVLSDSSPVYQIALPLAAVKSKVTVSGAPEIASMQSVTPTTLISRTAIQQTPGASLTDSLAMITDYVPGSYITHDMLHIRGGHQVSWLIDGVELPNTNIAANLAPVIDPRDIDYLDALRGSYNADYGDRTYGIFNIVPESGFEYNRNCDLTATIGNFYQTDDQVSCGGHTPRFAYYFSLNGNRSNLGLQPPIEQPVHDAANGYGGFASFIFNPNSSNQFRLLTSLRRDYYQVPIDPSPNSPGNLALEEDGVGPPDYGDRDSEHEPDAYVIFTWLRTLGPNMQLTVSPFFHYNGADYQAGPNDYPVGTTVTQTASYGGLQATGSANVWKNDVQVGVYGFGQHQYNYFDNLFTDGSPSFPASSISVNGGLVEEFFDDKFQPTSWLTLMAGLRQSHFQAAITENATDPRFGVDLRVPYLNWVFRAFYGDFYQPPPVVTATVPVQTFAGSSGFAFAPLRGERDTESQFGVTIPYRGWTLDADTFKTRAANWLDHNNIGESNLFWPITWNSALVRGWELTLRSPRIWDRGQLHLAYSNQIVENAPPVTGGLICPVSTPDCYGTPLIYFAADHDQRNTLNVGFDTSLPWEMVASTNVYYGSGFSNGLYGTSYGEEYFPQYSGPYLPSHTTFDLSLGKDFGENYSVSVTALNVANRRAELDTSFTIGGFHWNDPREIYGQFRYRFNF